MVTGIAAAGQPVQLLLEQLGCALAQGCGQRRDRASVSISGRQVDRAGPEALPHLWLLQGIPDSPTADGWQLRWVPHKDQTAVRRESGDQGLHQRQIHHRHFVNHDQIEIKRATLMASEAMPSRLQPTVQGEAGQLLKPWLHSLAQSARGLSRRSSKSDSQRGCATDGAQQHLHNGAGLARARATADQEHGHLVQGQHRLPLFGVQRLCGFGDAIAPPIGGQPGCSFDQLVDHRVHGVHPAPPADPLPLESQWTVGLLQPAAGDHQGVLFVRQRNRQLSGLEGVGQRATQRFELRCRTRRWTTAHQGGVERRSQFDGPACCHRSPSFNS